MSVSQFSKKDNGFTMATIAKINLPIFRRIHSNKVTDFSVNPTWDYSARITAK